MNYDEDKIDEYTLALLYLVTHERHEGVGARVWKGRPNGMFVKYEHLGKQRHQPSKKAKKRIDVITTGCGESPVNWATADARCCAKKMI
jgi:hypothetical protein